MNDRTVQFKRPAEVVTYDTRPIVLMTAPYHRKADLVAAVTRAAGRGEIRPQQARPVYNNRTGQWQIEVLRLRESVPAWIKPAAIATGILLMLGALLGLGWWMLASLAALPLGAFLAGALVALAVILRLGRGPSVTVTQTTVVRR